MLKSRLLFFVAALLVVVCLPIAGRNPQAASPSLAAAQNPAPAPTPSGKNPVKPNAESQARAKVLYGRDCAICHGDNGDGKTDLATSMNLTFDDWTSSNTIAGKTDSELFAIIRNGKGDKMPPEDAGRATDTDVWNLIIYVRALSKNRSPAPAPAPAAAPAPVQTPPADAPAPAPAPPTN